MNLLNAKFLKQILLFNSKFMKSGLISQVFKAVFSFSKQREGAQKQMNGWEIKELSFTEKTTKLYYATYKIMSLLPYLSWYRLVNFIFKRKTNEQTNTKYQ